jgi:hypothetical protein
MMIRHVALVTEVDAVSPEWLTRVAGALQKQVIRDFGPIWDIQATVSAYAQLDDVPLGYWPVIVVQDVRDAAGYHTDQNGQPISLVEYGSSWSLTTSHECLEMLADPFGNRLIAGGSPKEGQGKVEFLVEVCDPSEDEAYAYRVNDVLVSDFYTPQYFDPVVGVCVRYSFTGAITEPRQVLPGGYLSWHDPVSDHWFQHTYFDGSSEFPDLGVFEKGSQSIREMVDAKTPQTKRLSNLAADAPPLHAAVTAMSSAEPATASRAALWRSQIEALKAGS